MLGDSEEKEYVFFYYHYIDCTKKLAMRKEWKEMWRKMGEERLEIEYERKGEEMEEGKVRADFINSLLPSY